MITHPLDVTSLMAAGRGGPWDGAPPNTTMGHVHLHAGNLDDAEAFYNRALGFDKMAPRGMESPMIDGRGGCSHIGAVEAVTQPAARVCDECVTIGSRWVHLRTCQACGGTRCCDSSPNRHASKHARSSGHPVIASAEEGERWLYCYPDDAFAEY